MTTPELDLNDPGDRQGLARGRLAARRRRDRGGPALGPRRRLPNRRRAGSRLRACGAAMSTGAYLLSVLALGLVAVSMAVAGRTLRRALLPGWSGAPSLLASGVLGLGTLIVLSELLGLFGLLDGVLLTAACVIVGAGALRIEPMLMSPDAKAALAGAGPRDARPAPSWELWVAVALRARRRRSVGRADPARARPRHLRRRLALVPHAVRGSHRADGVGDRPAVHRPALPELVLPAELRAAARRRPAAARRRLPLAAAEPRLARRRAARGAGASGAPTARGPRPSPRWRR